MPSCLWSLFCQAFSVKPSWAGHSHGHFLIFYHFLYFLSKGTHPWLTLKSTLRGAPRCLFVCFLDTKCVSHPCQCLISNKVWREFKKLSYWWQLVSRTQLKGRLHRSGPRCVINVLATCFFHIRTFKLWTKQQFFGNSHSCLWNVIISIDPQRFLR